jgi:hypothetical protein
MPFSKLTQYDQFLLCIKECYSKYEHLLCKANKIYSSKEIMVCLFI